MSFFLKEINAFEDLIDFFKSANANGFLNSLVKPLRYVLVVQKLFYTIVD